MQQNTSENKEKANPKKNEPVLENLDFNNPDFKFIPDGAHEWRQQGFYIVCFSCPLQHASWIGRKHILVGIKDGQPVLKTRKELGME